MTVAVSITQAQVFAALRSFILGLISCEVVQGLGNEVPMPAGPFICMTPLFLNRLSTNVVTYNGTDAKASRQAVQDTIQLDCYGPLSGDWAVILSTLLRDEYAALTLAPNVVPLHADDPVQMPLIDGEENYEQRWVVKAVLQYNPVVSLPQDYMNAVNVNPISVDRTYPP